MSNDLMAYGKGGRWEAGVAACGQFVLAASKQVSHLACL